MGYTPAWSALPGAPPSPARPAPADSPTSSRTPPPPPPCPAPPRADPPSRSASSGPDPSPAFQEAGPLGPACASSRLHALHTAPIPPLDGAASVVGDWRPLLQSGTPLGLYAIVRRATRAMWRTRVNTWRTEGRQTQKKCPTQALHEDRILAEMLESTRGGYKPCVYSWLSFV